MDCIGIVSIVIVILIFASLIYILAEYPKVFSLLFLAFIAYMFWWISNDKPGEARGDLLLGVGPVMFVGVPLAIWTLVK